MMMVSFILLIFYKKTRDFCFTIRHWIDGDDYDLCCELPFFFLEKDTRFFINK